MYFFPAHAEMMKAYEKPAVPKELPKIPKLKQLFFDCDNTLVQTEGLAFSVTSGVVNALLEKKGVDKRYEGIELLTPFFGRTFKEMMPLLAQFHEFELTPEDFAEFIKLEEEAVIEIIKKEGVACKGVTEVLEKLKSDGTYVIAVVSSSSTNRITAALEKGGLLHFFKPEHIFSARTSLPKPVGKPEPDVYIHAMQQLGVQPDECMTVEDSRTGMFAADGAGIACIGYVGCYNGFGKAEQLEIDFEEQGALCTIRSWDEYFGVLQQVTRK